MTCFITFVPYSLSACAVTPSVIARVLMLKSCGCSTKQGELYGDRTAGFHGYSHLTGGFDGGQAEYARVPFGKSQCADFPLIHQCVAWFCMQSVFLLLVDSR